MAEVCECVVNGFGLALLVEAEPMKTGVCTG
jgi:hypothetical protein